MNRRQSVIVNFSWGLLKQVVIILCGFILPRYMLVYYGSSVTGLVSSISHFLGFITLLEMGVGPVVQASLYKPLAQKDTEQIASVLKASDIFFKRISYVLLIYIFILVVLFPRFINSEFDAAFTGTLVVIIAISTFAEYFFGMTYRLLLVAHQKAYVQSFLHVATVILNTAVSVVLIEHGFSIQTVKLSTAFIYVLRPLGQLWYVKAKYHLKSDKTVKKASLPQKWDSFAQHLAMVVLENVDVVALSVFSTLANVAVYNVYYIVVNSIRNLIMSAVVGLESYFGDMLARNEQEKLLKFFSLVEFAVHFAVTLIFSCTVLLIVPFVSIYTHGIQDADYIVPIFAFLITMAYCAQCIRVPYLRLIKGAGMFKETKLGAIVAMCINIVVTICAIKPFGLAGIAFGTLLAMLFHTIYFVFFLRNHILNRNPLIFFYNILADCIVIVLSIVFTRNFMLTELTYLSWLLLAVKIFLVVFGFSVSVQCTFHSSFIRRMVIPLIKRGGRND